LENSTYATITRQFGLANELRVIANNIANASTTGYQSEGVVFSEYITSLGPDDPSLSMAAARVRTLDYTQGALSPSGGTFDLAIEGEGYFLIDAPGGQRLSRAGNFTPDGEGNLVTMDGYRVLDAGGAPVFIPQGAGAISIAPDGTISAGNDPIGQIGLVVPTDPSEMRRQSGTLFEAPSGFEPAIEGRMLQGFLESSNVNPILQIGRMIEVQRAYELGQSFLDKEDERISAVINAVRR